MASYQAKYGNDKMIQERDRAYAQATNMRNLPKYAQNKALQNNKLRSDLMLSGYDPRGIQAVRAEALRAPGQDSPWASMALQRQGFEEQQALGNTAQQFAGQQAQAMAGLRGRGGLDRSAAMRMASRGAQQGALGMQGVRAQGIQQRSDVRLQDEQNRQDWLRGLAAQEEAYQAPDRFNIQNTLGTLTGDAASRNQFNQTQYQQKMDIWNKMIDREAQRRAGHEGSGW